MNVALIISVAVNFAMVIYVGNLPAYPRSPEDIKRIETLDRIVRKWEVWADQVPIEHRPTMWKPNELID